MHARSLSSSIENGGWPHIYAELKHRKTLAQTMKHIFPLYTATAIQFSVFIYQLV